MKNPIAYLKHIVKDPINTIDEANARKKEIMPLLYVSLGILVVSTILNIIIPIVIWTIFIVIGIIGAGLAAFLFFVISKAKEKFAALTCDCGEMFKLENPDDFAKYISYEVTNISASTSIRCPEAQNGVVSEITGRGSGSATVEIAVKCLKCGKTRTLVYNITPFKCEKTEKKVGVLVAASVKMEIETAVNAVVEKYKSDSRDEIPFSIHSVYNPKYAERTKAQMGKDTVSYPIYNGVKISYHRTVDEMVKGFFTENELNGKITVKK